jgi:hypothetical protein
MDSIVATRTERQNNQNPALKRRAKVISTLRVANTESLVSSDLSSSF